MSASERFGDAMAEQAQLKRVSRRRQQQFIRDQCRAIEPWQKLVRQYISQHDGQDQLERRRLLYLNKALLGAVSLTRQGRLLLAALCLEEAIVLICDIPVLLPDRRRLVAGLDIVADQSVEALFVDRLAFANGLVGSDQPKPVKGSGGGEWPALSLA